MSFLAVRGRFIPGLLTTRHGNKQSREQQTAAAGSCCPSNWAGARRWEHCPQSRACTSLVPAGAVPVSVHTSKTSGECACRVGRGFCWLGRAFSRLVLFLCASVMLLWAPGAPGSLLKAGSCICVPRQHQGWFPRGNEQGTGGNVEPLHQQLDATLVLRESGLGSQMRTSRSLHTSGSAEFCPLLWLCFAVSWVRIFACLLRLH